MPQIVWYCARSTSYATTAPASRASSAPTVAGQAVPVRLTQSSASSFVKRIGRLKPCSRVARKFEQKRW